MKRIKVKARDGTVREVDDSYVIQDGESYVITLTMMDGRSIIHDGLGNIAGQRPGFLFTDNERAEAALADAYRQYDADISSRWQSQRWQSQPSKPAPSAPQTFDGSEAAREQAYAQYRMDIQERWRK